MRMAPKYHPSPPPSALPAHAHSTQHTVCSARHGALDGAFWRIRYDARLVCKAHSIIVYLLTTACPARLRRQLHPLLPQHQVLHRQRDDLGGQVLRPGLQLRQPVRRGPLLYQHHHYHHRLRHPHRRHRACLHGAPLPLHRLPLPLLPRRRLLRLRQQLRLRQRRRQGLLHRGLLLLLHLRPHHHHWHRRRHAHRLGRHRRPQRLRGQ